MEGYAFIILFFVTFAYLGFGTVPKKIKRNDNRGSFVGFVCAILFFLALAQCGANV